MKNLIAKIVLPLVLISSALCFVFNIVVENYQTVVTASWFPNWAQLLLMALGAG